MRYLAVSFALAAVALAEAAAQQKVDIRRAAAPDVSVRLSGAFVSRASLPGRWTPLP
jgi:hypothetical protein